MINLWFRNIILASMWRINWRRARLPLLNFFISPAKEIPQDLCFYFTFFSWENVSTLVQSILIIARWLLNIIFCLWSCSRIRSILPQPAWSHFLSNTAALQHQLGFTAWGPLPSPPFSCYWPVLTAFYYLLSCAFFLSFPSLFLPRYQILLFI